jgi:ABC-type uncharacterized transport system substrate-binding protein
MMIVLLTALSGGSSNTIPPSNPGPESGSNARVVAWVDFDVEPARRVFVKFSEHLHAQSVDGARPVTIKFVGADVADASRLSAEMKDLAATHPDVIVATSVSVAKSLLALHTRVPLYFVSQSDPMRDGLVPSLVATGSLTGYTFFVPLDVKTIELIRRVFPACKTVGIVADALWLEGASMSQDLFAQIKKLGLDMELFQPRGQHAIRELLQDPRAHAVQVWYVPYTELAFDHGTDIAETLARSKAPTIYARRKFLQFGGLISIQAVDNDAMEVWAKSIAEILNGVPIGSIPVMRPKEIEIAANSAAVARLGRLTRDLIAREATVFE